MYASDSTEVKCGDVVRPTYSRTSILSIRLRICVTSEKNRILKETPKWTQSTFTCFTTGTSCYRSNYWKCSLHVSFLIEHAFNYFSEAWLCYAIFPCDSVKLFWTVYFWNKFLCHFFSGVWRSLFLYCTINIKKHIVVTYWT